MSRDHHWGPRVDILFPRGYSLEKMDALMTLIAKKVPKTFDGFPLGVGHIGMSGLSYDSLDRFFLKNLGRIQPPTKFNDWLEISEPDIVNVISGEVWHDAVGEFLHFRNILLGYYPEVVWKRRIAYWCRLSSTYGMYFIERALVRQDIFLATIALSNFLKAIMELTFLLNRRYFPYSKWLYSMFLNLPQLSSDIDPMIRQILYENLSWQNKKILCEKLILIIDQYMVKIGIIKSHRMYKWSTSGCRILDLADSEIIHNLPKDIVGIIPQEKQIFRESFHALYVAGLKPKKWQEICNIT